jgi:small subunit ribosomal protein S9
MTKETANKFIEAVGRRKTSTARVRMTPSTKQSVVVNDKELAEYFKVLDLQTTAIQPLEKSGIQQKFTITVKTVGGGSSSQAQAISLGVARAIELYDKNLRGVLKSEGLLTRDQRAKERRKFGLKKARKAPQWSKR